MAVIAPQFQARPRSGAVRGRAPRLAAVLTGAGLALLPWMVVLARTLPQTAEVSNWSTAWVGFDALLAAGLTGTGLLLRKGDPRVAAVAGATAALLVADAWLDVTTSAGTAGQGAAVLMALAAELPLAVACAVVAARRTA
ncbi:LPXTG cell wall anchor domain-containing protein [Streptomyces sp. NPDC047976]|uniref:LPXTG cell wall anchor domain-containing protein n=1 Tax=unclassified Streptomyces TaxID=2593676 RepID=UPI0034351545